MISFEVGKDKFNFRVSAIIIDKSGTRFLTNTRENIDFCVLPGGRVEMGEETPVSLKREMIEELGVEIDIVGLKAITENFFEFDNKNYHELQYLYIAKLLDDSIENNLVFHRDEEVIWICRNCGHIYKGKDALEMCPVCKHSRSYMELRSVNY